MLSIGPYVVVREISTRTAASLGARGKTYRATDRLTGIPVLLHHLPALSGLPTLPAHPALLPFTDIVVQAGEAYLVTELPPNAVPAREPLQAARGALLALAVLHKQGLAHGGIDAAQLWSVDGPVRLAGGGRHALGGEFTVARDLHDLATTLSDLGLSDLGALPPVLASLQTSPDGLDARQVLALLAEEAPSHSPGPAAPGSEPRGVKFQSRDLAPATPAGILPNLNPLSLLNPSAPLPQTPSFVTEAVLTSVHEPRRSSTDPGVPAPPLPFTLDMDQWHLPDYIDTSAHVPAAGDAVAGNTVAGVPTVVPADEATPASTASLEWTQVERPLHQSPTPEVNSTPDLTPPPPEEHGVVRQGRQVKAAASQALQRLKTDGQRLRHLQEMRRDEVAAQLAAGGEPGSGLEAPNLEELARTEALPAEDQAPQVAETPQERRRREHEARVQEAALAAQLAQTRGMVSPASSPPGPSHAAPSHAESAPAQEELALPPRQLKGVKMRWDEKTASWQRVTGEGGRDVTARPAWLLPALLGLVLLLGLLVWGLSRRPAAARAAPAAAGQCCTVNFRVSGGGRASISILNTTSRGRWAPGEVIGKVPGTLNLPGPGQYKLGVTSEGFSPANVDVTVPTSQPVTIRLGP
ncbi:hypothetical protein [Deinococcus fonticola]|uniref:hypothetical protein n=1 Tax=Deinococcus fonticola TaxID=2528713 RepID=UPI0010753CB4|nr:hypothetical protein [Deinococcus fonticola]